MNDFSRRPRVPGQDMPPAILPFPVLRPHQGEHQASAACGVIFFNGRLWNFVKKLKDPRNHKSQLVRFATLVLQNFGVTSGNCVAPSAYGPMLVDTSRLPFYG